MSAQQAEIVYLALKERGSLTSMEAFTLYGFTRLAARIDDLKKIGVEIESTTEPGINRYGKNVYFSRYRIAEGSPVPTSFVKPTGAAKKPMTALFHAGFKHAIDLARAADPMFTRTAIGVTLIGELKRYIALK